MTNITQWIIRNDDEIKKNDMRPCVWEKHLRIIRTYGTSWYVELGIPNTDLKIFSISTLWLLHGTAVRILATAFSLCIRSVSFFSSNLTYLGLVLFLLRSKLKLEQAKNRCSLSSLTPGQDGHPWETHLTTTGLNGSVSGSSSSRHEFGSA